MNKYVKRLGAVTLAAGMLCGMVCSASAVNFAAKIGSTGYATLSEAMEKVQNGQTIVVQSNITNETAGNLAGVQLYYDGAAAKSFAIDFNGHSLTENRSGDPVQALALCAGEKAGQVSITLKNGKISAGGENVCGIYIGDDNTSSPMTVTLQNMTVQAKGDAGILCSGAKLISQANVSGVDDAVFAEDSTIELVAGTYTAAGQDSDDGVIAAYRTTGEDSAELDFSLVRTPEAPAIVRPADWTSLRTMSLTVIHFADVKPSWYYDYVYGAAQKGIVSGVGNVWTFLPNNAVTREQFAVILANTAGADLSRYKNISQFRDVPAGKWSAAGIEWARANGVLSGKGNGIFAPADSITRQEACVMLYQFQTNVLKLEPRKLVEVPAFADRSEVSSWAETARSRWETITQGPTTPCPPEALPGFPIPFPWMILSRKHSILTIQRRPLRGPQRTSAPLPVWKA